MSRNTNNLLDEYRYADHTKRLHLYLQYPELRPEFALIERNESEHGQFGSKPARTGVPMPCKARLWSLSRMMPRLEKRVRRRVLPFLGTGKRL